MQTINPSHAAHVNIWFCDQCGPRSDAAERGVRSGFTLFATHQYIFQILKIKKIYIGFEYDRPVHNNSSYSNGQIYVIYIAGEGLNVLC